MPVNVSIKGVPDELAARLRERAGANHRSLQGELMAILHEAMAAGGADWRARLRPAGAQRPPESTLDGVIARIKARGHALPVRGASSTDIIRQLRDQRLAGRHPADAAPRAGVRPALYPHLTAPPRRPG